MGRFTSPLTCLGKPPLSPMKVWWVCGGSVVFLLYLVGAEEEEGLEASSRSMGHYPKSNVQKKAPKVGVLEFSCVVRTHVLCKCGRVVFSIYC